MKIDAEITNLYKIMLCSMGNKININRHKYHDTVIVELYYSDCEITDYCLIDEKNGIFGGRIIGYWNKNDDRY